MGRVPLEAASFARPSVAFAVGGLPDVVRDGETGWLVKAGNWNAFAEVLARLVEHPQPEVGRTARSWVEEAADPVRYARWLVRIYHELGSPESVSEVVCERC